MAKLLKTPAKGHWDMTSYGRWRNGSSLPSCGCSYDECSTKVNADLEAIDDDNIMRFHVADGYALYEVVKEQPLTIRHIPCFDAYEAEPALIRGLRYDDLVKQRKWNNMFKKAREINKVKGE